MSLLVDAGRAEHQRIKSLYDTRNDIAHGRFSKVGPLNVARDFQDLVRLSRALDLT